MKTMISGCLAILLAASLTSCKSEDTIEPNPQTSYVWTTDNGLKACNNILFTNGKEDVNGHDLGNGDQEFVFTGNQKLPKGVYTLKGWIYIANGAQLTLEPGTVIKGDKTSKAAIIVERGGKLLAQGTATSPIVFTSNQPAGNRKPGDWGGIILCGKAKNNQREMQIEGGPRTKHGGNDDTDNSGILSYVRIEFAGYPFQRDKEINALTLASVGSGTQIDHIQVSYSNDDAYEWFGGKVDCRYLISYKSWDDDFDTDNGYSGRVQFGYVERDARIADTSLSNAFESDNSADGGSVVPFTAPTFSNITVVGPRIQADFVNTTGYITGGNANPNNGSALGKFQSALHIRRNSQLNCHNSVFIGYPVGLILDNQKGDTQGAASKQMMALQNLWMVNVETLGCDANKLFADVLVTGYDEKSQPIKDESQKSFSTTFFNAQTGNKAVGEFSSLMLDSRYMPTATSPLTRAAAFTHSGLTTWFTRVDYIGAFGVADNWMNGWTNFDPINTIYE